MPNTAICTHVTSSCPVSATTYGYYPNLGGNITLCVIFALCFISQTFLSIKGRTWTWMISLFIGCGLEFAGYIGRILMNSNPWSQGAFRLQIIALILAPSFINAGIDLTLKHLVIRFGRQYSLIKPALYTWIFITIDIFSIVIQASGGGLAAAGETKPDLLTTGNDVILAGIIIQVAQLAVFGLLSFYYGWNVYRQRDQRAQNAKQLTPRLEFFLAMLVLAYVCILVRCIYRIPEMAGGWGSKLQREEVKFLTLDGMVVAIAAIALTVAHPTIFFPDLGKGPKLLKDGHEQEEKSERASDSST